MNGIVPKAHLETAQTIRRLMARYEEIELLVQVGEFQSGRDPEADFALARHKQIQSFLRQGRFDHIDLAATLAEMTGIAHG